MTDNSDATYEVGYKKPPKATQFPPGTSGNASGRPKKAPQPLDPGVILEAIDNEEISVTVKGKRKRMTKAEIQFRRLFARGIFKGDLTAARLLVKMAVECFRAQEASNPGYEIISETEAARRFGRNWRKRVEEHNAGLGGRK